MKKFLKLALSAIVVISIASCSGGVSSKYPPTGDMDKDAKALINEVMKENRDDAKYEEMANSYEAYYKGEGKLDEFEKALEKAMSEEMTNIAAEAVEATAEEAAAVEEKAAETPAESMEDYKAELEESIKNGPPTDDPVWDKFETMLQEKTVFPVTIDSVVKAGVVAFVDEVRAFIPASKLAAGYVENLEDYIGENAEHDTVSD